MKSVTSPQDLVDSLLNAGDKLVVVDFFSPGCGGCKALHPKVIRSQSSEIKKQKTKPDTTDSISRQFRIVNRLQVLLLGFNQNHLWGWINNQNPQIKTKLDR